MARALAVAGSSVALTGRSGERARQVAADLPGAIGLPLDVRSEASVAAAVQEAWSRLGGVDMLVNNAGIGMRTVNPGFMTEPQGFWLVSPAGFRDVIETNLTGYFLMAREITPRMLATGAGRIVNVSSYTARVPEPFCAPYSAAKAALVNVTRNLSRAYGSEGICANCVLPGLTYTEGAASVFEEAMAATGRSENALVESMLRRAPIDVGRMGTASEVAAAVAFLCSARASWITGVVLPVDGGTIRSAP